MASIILQDCHSNRNTRLGERGEEIGGHHVSLYLVYSVVVGINNKFEQCTIEDINLAY